MFLKALTLKGFKSFADSTTLVFEPGVTVIVGPNGSGKSNVVDAVAWALGAQAPTSVRSAKMDDVIFAGTASRAGLGRAEVSLSIDNTSRLLPIEFEEVTITRTLFRSGDSTYAINGVPCRLLDIQELLSDSGVGRQQHVIVSQRQIEGVLSARPEDRRAVIEEAAGVLKYRRRKEKSERRLAASEANLTRLSDVVREIRRQLRPLERQAEAARRHGDLLAELSGLRRYIAGQEIDQLRQRVRQLTQDQAADRREMQQITVQAEALDRDLAAAEAQLSAADGQDISDALVRFEGITERLRGLEALLSERNLRLQRDRDVAMDEDVVATLEAESNRLASELLEVEDSAAAMEPEAAAVAGAEEELEQLRLSFDERWGDQGVPESDSDAPRIKGEIRILEASIHRDQAESDLLGRNLEALEGRRQELVEELDRCWAEAKEAEIAQQARIQDYELAERFTQEARAAHEQQKAALGEAVGVLQAWEARREALSLALDEARDQSGAQRLVGVEGVLGTLLEVVEVDRGWEAAFEAAAGEAIAAVIATDTEVAMRAIATLEADSVSGAVLALGGSAPPAPTPLVGDPLRPRVRSSVAGVDQLLDALIGTVGVLESSELAAEAVIGEPAAVVVTRRGDRFSSSGWRVGVRRSGATRGLLEEAEEASARAREAAEAAEQQLVVTEHQLGEARRNEARAREVARQHSDSLDAVRARGNGVERELRDAEVGIGALGPRRSELEARIDEDRRRLDDLLQELPQHQAKEVEQRARAENLYRDRDELAQKYQAVGSLRSDYKVRTAGIEERRRLLTAQRDEVERRLSQMDQSRAEAASRREAVDQRLSIVDQLLGLVSERAKETSHQLEGLRLRRAEESEAARAAAQRLEGLRSQRALAEARLGQCRERDRSAGIELAESGIRLEAATDRCRRELDCEPGEAVAAECPPLEPGIAPADRVRALEQELRIMGPVNPLALEEFEALSERYEFTQAQIDDIRQSRRELRKVIRKIDEEIVGVFSSAYADVARNFADLFETLFPGGEGKLRLTQPDALLDTGVEIEARPSGKNIRRLSLLSGGERSLTALAFLFAVFRSRPSPFYVMDEVEAALDDVNLHRFLQLVDEFRADAQLLIVSHQKRTMEAADCLYGVSMKPGGSSKVLSERVVVASEPKVLVEQG
ncbi:chromosome segregation protein SMC [Candidatus Poriferisocius sp.]|uniref:chromosome segregation protein SMC n=1 Tax=Candidatus Poriferisocius sp. TaxID=3101276 RepID=UPI003B028B57